ncbi:HEAT repeat domain-containing protein [Synechococcus sp. PCC 7336]|uniref:HEAT repeat domain-containing protein n=1 Tax=Synechococcus sp. PCC 7336 TaxID=195250 RepID=UPI000348731C|nr:HEAT repeat domain-containing protein [Synechococcus sp. PCC 7336]
MDKRFFRLFDMSEDEAIALLDKPIEDLEEDDVRYVAAAHLVNFPTDRSIAALIRAVENTHPSLDNRITRRKAIETLGRLEVREALPFIRVCLQDDDRFTVENAAKAIAEITTDDAEILAEIAQLLDKPEQCYRSLIQVLSKLGYKPALDRIRNFLDADSEPLYSAAISAVCKLSGDDSQIGKVIDLLQHPSVNARRSSIQDLIDADYYRAIPKIAACPVSIVFRLRAIRLMAGSDLSDGKLIDRDLYASLDRVLMDRPSDLNRVHQYDALPPLDVLIKDLYSTDFGRCYLATQTLVEQYPEAAPKALFATYETEARQDYGAHYHVIKSLGWLRYAPAYDLFIEALNNTSPQFQKSRSAAALALAELGERKAIPALRASSATKIWALKYASILALEAFGDSTAREVLADDPDRLIRARATQAANSVPVS